VNRIKVMIVEDSLAVQEILKHIIGQDERLEVVACVASAEEALRDLNRIGPDVISLDIRLPRMDGLEATLKIMEVRPTPIVVISENIEAEELKISMNALKAGALAVVEKPVGLSHRDFQKCAELICDQLVNMSTVKLVRQRIGRNLSFGPKKEIFPTPLKWQDRVDPFQVLGVVASTGGPNALLQLFQVLPRNFPLPIVLVQHISSPFLQSFATWLGGNCPFPTRVIEDGEEMRPGTIFLSPADYHLEVEGKRMRISARAPVNSHCPSGDVLFHSIARSVGRGGMGVILTGMGADGADGLLAMRRAGGYTIGEDKSTAVVYGMPGVAQEIGASCESLPIDAIGGHILEVLANSKKV
jgi:two-component system chemotaxis response regulator CheB